MLPQIGSIVALASADLVEFIVEDDKTVFNGIGRCTLEKMQARARLVTNPNPQPYLKEPLALPFLLAPLRQAQIPRTRNKAAPTTRTLRALDKIADGVSMKQSCIYAEIQS